ncbi:MAG: ABC transporter permease [Bacteroidota bacterium]
MKKPPNWLYNLFKRCTPKNRIDLLGDFEEWYHELVEEKGNVQANFIWIFQSLTLLKLKAITKLNSKSHFLMIGLPFKTAKRNFLKNKLYTIINLLGLSVGITVCTLIALFINHELSYDKHFGDHEQIYRVAGIYDQGGDTKTTSTLTPFLLQSAMQNNLDSQVMYTRLDFLQLHITVNDQTFWEDYSIAVDPNFFEVFQITFISGDASTALKNPYGIVLDRTTALKLFKHDQVMGETLKIEGRNHIITGIIEDLPDNTHFECHAFISIESIKDLYPYWMTNTYGGVSHRTYLKVPENYDVAQLEISVNELIAHYVDEEARPTYFFQHLKDIHLNSDLVAEIEVNGSYRILYIFLATAIVILLLASINFMNLSVAGAFRRLKETGVKKVMGASRSSQIWQFQLEALLMGLVASLITILLINLSLPSFNATTGKEIRLDLVDNLLIFGVCFILLLVISLITGRLSALFLLKVPVPNALFGIVSGDRRNTLNPRNILVGVQFFLAAILLSSTLVIFRQLYFMQNKDLGIDTEQLLVASFQSPEGFENYPILKEKILKNAFIESVSASTSRLAYRVGGWRQYKKPNTVENIHLPTVIVAHDYFETINVDFVLGRGFNDAFPSDYTDAYVINESAAKFLKLEHPIGAQLKGSAYTGQTWSVKDAKIIGVVEDFHFTSLHDKIQPAVFSLSSEITYPLQWMFIKINGNDLIQSLEAIEEIWSEIHTSTPFRYQFLDDAFEEHYLQEKQFLNVFSAFAFLSIFIGCLGLFGLTAFIMHRRTKEIGIRKVLGASRLVLLKVLSIDFLKLVFMACILGTPITLWLMAKWLENFEYRTSISWWIFGLTAMGALVSAGVSIFYHSMKVANTNPIESIKYE